MKINKIAKALLFSTIFALALGLSSCMAQETTGVWVEVYIPTTTNTETINTTEAVITNYAEAHIAVATIKTSEDHNNLAIYPEEDIVYEELPTEYPELEYSSYTPEDTNNSTNSTEAIQLQYYQNGEQAYPEEYTEIIEILGERGKISLTFDDGPIAYTELILDILEAYNSRATFCVLGYRVEDWQDTILRTVNIGSEVVGHSWDHANFTRLNTEQIKFQIEATSAAIAEVIGQAPPRVFRAPYGATNPRVFETAEEIGYSLLHWSIDPKDWRNRDADYIYYHIMNKVTRGSIILLHDIHPTTAEAMERVIPRLVEEGFELVTATELIEYIYGPLEPGIRYVGLR